MELSKEQLNELYKKLPQEMRSVEFTERASNAIRSSAEKNKWLPEQTRVFAETVWKIIVGALQREKMADELAVRLSLPPEQAQKVAVDIDREIFKGGEAGGGFSSAPKPPLPIPPPGGGSKRVGWSTLPTPPRPVPITKVHTPPPPPRQSSGQAPTTPTLQTILADIRRGTAYDERRIEETFRKTPIEVRQTLESVGFLSRLENIAKKFGLNVEETGELVSESGLVMLGLTLPVQFVDNLGKRLRLPRDRAMAVGQAVNMEVLRPVREILRKMGQPTQNTPPLPIPPLGGGSKRVGLLFAPSIQPPTKPQNPPPRLIGGQATPSFIKEGEAGGGFSPPTPEVKKYTTDPYREPLE